MIKYALICTAEHTFEAWFSSSSSYDDQAKRGLVECPVCGSTQVSKQIMAPSIKDSGAKKSKAPSKKDFEKFAGKVREHIADTHDYVGDKFASEARAMYYGEQDHRPVWGETSTEDAKALVEEGVPATPLPAPFAPKPPKDDSKLN